MASKPKSALSDTPNKTSPVTPRVSKPSTRGFGKSETDSHSPLQSSRLSVDRSPRALPPKTTIDRRSPKLATPPEKQTSRLAKGSELQAQLSTAQEDLKKAKEQIVLAEKEKAKALEELKEAQRVAEEANEKLREAVVAQKRAEDSSEIEKFRAVELEQAGIEATQKKDEEWEKAIESVKTQHAIDVSTLQSITEELQRLKQELAMTCDAKNQALSHADDATKIAETQAEKAETLLAELNQLKTMLDSKNESETSQKHKIVMELTSEVASLRQELERAKSFEEKLKEKEASFEQLNVELEKAKCFEVKLVEKEASIKQLNVELEKAKCFEVELVEKEASMEQLNVELEAARMAESYARSVVEELKSNVDELERQVKEAHRLERAASESLELVMKQLEENNEMLQGARTEVSSLKGKMGLLEITIERQKVDLEESDLSLGMAKDETSEMAKLVESLKSELQAAKEEKKQALNNEKLAASKVQTLIEEKAKLANELENSRDEEEKSKKAMESLASALHEVSAEAREAKEKLLSGQVENESHETQIEDLKLVLKATNEKYESLLDEAKHEMDSLTSTIERSRAELNDSRGEWEDKEIHLVSCVKKSEEENSSLQSEVNRLVNLLNLEKEKEAQLKESLKEVESEAIYLQEALAEAKSESMKLKESVLDKETELQNISHENEELRAKEASALKRAEELSKSLEEVTAEAKKQSSENGEVSETEKDYDLLPKVVEFSEENGHAREVEEPKSVNDGSKVSGPIEIDHLNGKAEKEEEKKGESVEAVETEYKMWESVKIEKKEFSPEREAEGESFDDEADSKVSGGVGENFDQTNGVSSNENNDASELVSPTQEQKQPKKKKPLLHKFGSLLKKKGSSTPK